MQNPIKALAGWVAGAIVDKISEPFEAINKRLTRLEKLHEQDAAALECDLSMMDDRICYLIGVCRRRGYTTADERRRVTRMNDAYKARGGNHGEETRTPCSSRCLRKRNSTGRKGLNMKINIPVRFKNPWFWVTLAGLFFTAIGVSPETLTSWDALRQAMVDFISNPFLIASAAVALLGQFIDPTTAGICDSKQAMGYTEPKRDDA